MSQMQLPLPEFMKLPESPSPEELLRVYSSDGITSIDKRVNLELEYAHLLKTTQQFDRRLVSFQANKNTKFHSWLKYKEGFSSKLVETLFDKFSVTAGQRVLDPFAGSGTTLLVAQSKSVNAVGIDILPLCHLAWKAKSRYQQYDLQILQEIRQQIDKPPLWSEVKFPHVAITQSAFTEEQERKLMGYKGYFESLSVDDATRDLLQLVLMSVLEDISFTRKDGQYLRWDNRSQKAQQRDANRTANGKTPYHAFYKGEILDVSHAVQQALDRVIRDIEAVQKTTVRPSEQVMLAGTVLEILPTLDADQFDAVITSPPYCNRYDYTRTYALELAFLGVTHQGIVNLRQEQLSCTVENRSKLAHLKAFYEGIGRANEYHTVIAAIDSNFALQEVFTAMEVRNQRGDLNNKGVVQMVRGYFTELAFVIYELYRVCKSGANIAIVNDNVRYGGEIIPVDLLMTDLAVTFGFAPLTVYVLQQRKGNSSQQMGKFGREALRKSITVWQKPSSGHS